VLNGTKFLEHEPAAISDGMLTFSGIQCADPCAAASRNPIEKNSTPRQVWFSASMLGILMSASYAPLLLVPKPT